MEVDKNHQIREDKIEKKKKKKKRKILDVKMQVVKENPEKIAPLVGYFPSGYDPHKLEDEDNTPQVRLFRKRDTPKRLELVVSPKDCKVDFIGSTHSGEAATSQVCRYALGVFDKETQSLKIIPIAYNKVLRLEPRIGGLDVEGDVEEEILTEEQKANARKGLTSAFGSKRQNKQDEKKASLKEITNPNALKDLETKIGSVKINKEAVVGAVPDPTRNIPPYNSTATTPEKAYPLDDIILPGEWDYLSEILELVQSGTEITPNAYPSFVCNRMQKLTQIEDEAEQQKLACIFAYITYLVRFRDRRSAGHASKEGLIPPILFKKFMRMFTDPEKYVPSVEKTNCLFSYILVLTLHADGFRTDMNDIAKDLRVTPLALRDRYKILGCKLSHENKLVYAGLPVPLQFPKPMMGKRRRQ